MIIKQLTEEYVTEDFLFTLESLRPTGLTVLEAKELFKKNNPDGIYVALNDDKVIGTATLVLENKFIHRGGIIGHVEDVAVHKEYQGKGVGLALISKLVQVGESLGCYKLILDCKPELENFYNHFEFYVTQEVNMRLNLGEVK